MPARLGACGVGALAGDRELRERLNRRRTCRCVRGKNRCSGCDPVGSALPLRVLRAADAMALLEQRGLPEVWRRSVAEALAVIDILDARIAPRDRVTAARARR